MLLLLVLALFASSVPDARAQGENTDPAVEALLAQMSPAERVGQLFIVTFPGADTGEGSVAETLVRELQVGGVVLRASNGNYVNSGDTASELAALTSSLQGLALSASAGGENTGPFLPLLIGIDLYSPTPLYADGLPQNGFTRLPSEMTLGATWDPQDAQAMGSVVGREVNAVGINLLLGPLLDVVDASSLEQQATLGTRSFGSNPYWVGEMGHAFVRGVREGSGGRVASIAGRFPGVGSSDRSSDEEIATVQKPMQALQAQDLPPFYAVTRASAATTDTVTVDGLQVSNVRYRALQGGIRQTTRPLSLDAQSLPSALAQPGLQAWRAAGGILMSEELGSAAVRRFYEQQTGEFPARTVAQHALNAGNDLLFLSDFALQDDWEARLENVEETIQFFTEQYQTDSTFAARVDESVRRILALKLRLYDGDFSPAAAPLPDPVTLDPPLLQSAEHLNTVARIAQESATLLFPPAEELGVVLPAPPLSDENIVIITDARPVRDCLTCPSRPTIDPQEMENILLQRFGPAGSAELDPERISSLSFEELAAFLSAPEGPPEGAETAAGSAAAVQEALSQADWLIFLVQDKDPAFPESSALSTFLRTFNPQLQAQRVVVFSFGAPYYLDATEISKVTAYYALYTASPRFLDAAASLLFQTSAAPGRPPVSLYPLNYDVEARLEPNPNQTVELCSAVPAGPLESCVPLPQTLDVSEEGTTEIHLRTSIIRDYNGNPVPDGTPINFAVRYPNVGVEQPPQTAFTTDGVATTSIMLFRGELLSEVLSITAAPVGSAPFTSAEVRVTVQGVAQPVVTVVVPTLTSTPQPTPTLTPTLTPTFAPTARPTRTPTSSPTPTTTPEPAVRFGQDNEGFGWWVFVGSVLGLVAVGGLGAAYAPRGRTVLLRRLLMVGLYGLGAYLGYLLLYGLRLLPDEFGGWGAVALAVVGGFIALVRGR